MNRDELVEKLRAHAGFVENGGCVDHSMTDEASLLRRAADALSAKDRELAEIRQEALDAVLSMIFMPGVRKALDALPEDDPIEPYLKRIRDLESAERERDEAMAALREKEDRVKALEEALDGIYTYCNDTLSGRADGGPDDRAWQREAVIRARNLARPFARPEIEDAVRSVLSSVQPVSGSREQRGNEEG